MSFLYSTNSPDYLNYIAHTKTRFDILNDPRLCVLLEDPYIKDNMELALLYKKAQYGNYEDKREFIGYFLANGPELDTDTIMYFREKILHSPTYSDIYYNEFRDIAKIDDLRINTYGKDTTDTNDLLNCLQNPCDYLGPFSANLGKMGDSNEYATFTAIISKFWKEIYEDSGASSESDVMDKAGAVAIPIAKHLYGKLSPKILEAAGMVTNSILGNWYDFGKKCRDSEIKGMKDWFKPVGDPRIVDWAKDVSTSIKANTIRDLGDCHRIWEKMRRFRFYDQTKNVQQPADLPAGSKTALGTPGPGENSPTDSSLIASQRMIQVSGINSAKDLAEVRKSLRDFYDANFLNKDSALKQIDQMLPNISDKASLINWLYDNGSPEAYNNDGKIFIPAPVALFWNLYLKSKESF
jgi:hypothetical protein